jgi:two-component system response regulator RstA
MELFCELQNYLQGKGIEVYHIDKADLQRRQVLPDDPNLIVLDCSDRDVAALALCRKIRNSYRGPLVLICHPEQEQFAFLALELGADFSISAIGSTPFIAENIRAMVVRLTSSSSPELQYGELTIDAQKREAFISGRRANLSTIEFRLLWLLCTKAGQVVSRETIHRKLYQSPYNGYDRGIDLYISRIRQKIGDTPASPLYLKTVRGLGYQFVGSPDAPLPSSKDD